MGGHIVQHLLMRGESPDAIRILDLATPKTDDLISHVDFIQTDVSNLNAVREAFTKAWPKSVAARPLTVFHCAAIITSQDRNRIMLPKYVKVNLQGTENVLIAAREAGASILIATSSASVAIRAPSYFPYPWQRWPKNIAQVLPNAQPLPPDAPLEEFAACYTWTKTKAEELVLKANIEGGMLTGAIRPGHAIYGAAESPSSVTYDYLRRGGAPSWIPNVISHFVNAINVSVAHLAYESSLLNETHSGGKGYLVTDPNPPIRYGDLYRFLETLAHPSTPIRFPYVPHIVMLLMAYPIEQYVLLRNRGWQWLPQLPADLLFLQPAIFQVCTLHIIYDDSAARKEIGYKAPIDTLEGFSLAVLDWNEKVERKAKTKLDQGKGGEIKIQDAAALPQVPRAL